MSKVFIGVDLSITSPGVSCLNPDGTIRWMKFFASKPKWEGWIDSKIMGIPYPIYGSDQERFHKIGSSIISLIEEEISNGNSAEVALEGYSYGSTASRLFQIAENGGHFKYLMWSKNIPFEIVAPTTVKKLATGKGNSQKQLVYDAFVEKYQINLHDIFDISQLKVS